MHGDSKRQAMYARTKYAREFGVTTACTIRMAEQEKANGSTLLGDSWFAYVY
jgi:hypothetical protein